MRIAALLPLFSQSFPVGSPEQVVCFLLLFSRLNASDVVGFGLVRGPGRPKSDIFSGKDLWF